jgi:hypothetical protein
MLNTEQRVQILTENYLKRFSNQEELDRQLDVSRKIIHKYLKTKSSEFIDVNSYSLKHRFEELTDDPEFGIFTQGYIHEIPCTIAMLQEGFSIKKKDGWGGVYFNMCASEYVNIVLDTRRRYLQCNIRNLGNDSVDRAIVKEIRNRAHIRDEERIKKILENPIPTLQGETGQGILEKCGKTIRKFLKTKTNTYTRGTDKLDYVVRKLNGGRKEYTHEYEEACKHIMLSEGFNWNCEYFQHGNPMYQEGIFQKYLDRCFNVDPDEYSKLVTQSRSTFK